MSLKRWQRTHIDMVCLAEAWRSEAQDAPESGARRFVLESCAAQLDALWTKRRPFARLRMWLLAQRWSYEASHHAVCGEFDRALTGCASILEIRSL